MRFKRDPNTFVPHRTLKWTSACTKIFIYPDPHDPDPYIHTSFLSASLAIDEACRLAEIYGVGVVAVDNAFHYLWGAGYVMRAAEKGFIAFTTCTGAIPEGSAIGPRSVLPKMFGNTSSPVPFPLPQLCRTVALPTNPHTWAFPTKNAIGYDFVMDWSTSVISNGRVKELKREGKPCPKGACLDKDGEETTDPSQVAALLTFGAHKGYGLSLVTELMCAFGGGSSPLIRCNHAMPAPTGDKPSPNFYFQVGPDPQVAASTRRTPTDRKLQTDANFVIVVDVVLLHISVFIQTRSALALVTARADPATRMWRWSSTISLVQGMRQQFYLASGNTRQRCDPSRQVALYSPRQRLRSSNRTLTSAGLNLTATHCESPLRMVRAIRES